jgi:Mrp family chromosome partitioning ATPase
MERLQTAIEKARAQRGSRTSRKPVSARPGAPEAQPEADPELQARWDALAEIRLNRDRLHRNRLIAFEGGQESAPYDMLRTKMLQQAKQHGWRRVALVSPHSSCGKSTAAANLAFSLSRQRNLRSLVFDLDLRRAGLTRLLGQSSSCGMAEVLEGEANFADHALRFGPNIAFGFNNGTKVHTPSEILQNPRTKEVLDEIEATYAPDVMLFDMPPLMASDDNFGFLHNVDCALIMVAAERTGMSQIDVAERQIAELTNVMGIVLNKCRYTNGVYGNEYDYY